jgi:3-hydroxybutyryl-CoA dehydrogenase
MITEKTRIAVIGAGTMGANIALSFAAHGFGVCLCDVSEAQLDKARAGMRKHAGMMQDHGMGSGSAEELFSRIDLKTQMDASVAGADLVIEAVRENLQLKLQVFTKLDRLCAPEVVLASTTSTFVPTALTAGLVNPGRKGRFLVMHYWNPAHLIPLVEVVPHSETKLEVLEFVRALLVQCDMLPILLRKEIPGFIGNRLAFALQREAMSLIANGVATAEDIDKVVTNGFGRRVPVCGVFGTADLGGLDVYLAICRQLFPDLCNDTKPPAILVRQVEQGKLGVKAGEGWKKYTPDQVSVLYEVLTKELVHQAQRDRLARSNCPGLQSITVSSRE